MSFTSTLSIAVSGLEAATTRAKTAANNIANANTEGYTRRSAVIAERTVGAVGAGVSVVTVESAKVTHLTNDRMRLEAENSFATEKAEGTERLTGIIGEPGVENGIFRSYALFETALKDAAATPESPVLARQVVDAGIDLARTFGDLSAAADAERTTADNKIAAAIDEVNSALTRLEGLNALPQTEITPEISDERQRLVDQINQYIPVRVVQDSGTLQLATDGGSLLLTERAHLIEFTATGNVGRTQTLGAPLSGLTVDGIDITPGGGAPHAVRGGQISALFEYRDVTVPGFQTQLDALATDVINRFADDTVDPTKTAGESGLFTDGTTTPPTGVPIGIAASIQINALVDPAQGGEIYRIRDGLGAVTEGAEGNGDQLNRLVEAFTGQRAGPAVLGIAGELGASELASEVSSSISFDDQKAADAAAFSTARLAIAREAEVSAIGVDTDQELQKLLLIEQAYAANARVIQTVDEMLQQLLSIV